MLRFARSCPLLLLACGGGDAGTGTPTTSSGLDTTAVPEDSSSGDPVPTTDATTTGTGATSSTGDASSSTGATDLPDESGWRSELYPEDWTPDFTAPGGEFLHDFSYAGYHNGEAPLAQDLPALTIDVVADHGADPTGSADATGAFQAALTAATAQGGAIVEVPAGLYRLDGQLSWTGSRIVLRGSGPEQTRLWFTQFAGLSNRSHLEIRGTLQLGADMPLVADGASRASTVELADAGALQPGDDVAIGWTITPEFIEEHGMTGTWMAFNNTWQPFFWRTVVAVAGATVTLDVPLRYPAKMRDQASLRPVSGYLRELGIESLGIADAVAWDDAWAQDQVHVLSLRGVADAWVRDVASYPSPGAPAEGFSAGRHLQSGGIEVLESKRVTIADSRLALPEHRGDGGNGYLFEVSRSSEVLVRDCEASAGRHNFIQNWGFGATGIVWLRIHSEGGVAVAFMDSDAGTPGLSEFHHSLATANLIDRSVLDDGWGAVNRGSFSSGAGHSATESVIWNAQGSGVLRSRQYGRGYVIGPGPELWVETATDQQGGAGTEPEDRVERAPPDASGPLIPASLYEDQLARRLGG